jgi:hypothetical protein
VLSRGELVGDAASTPVDALCDNIEEMRKWVAAARAGKFLDNVIPVNAPATLQNADAHVVDWATCSDPSQGAVYRSTTRASNS